MAEKQRNVIKEYRQLSIDEIKPYELNARHHPKRQITRLCQSIKKFGFTTPIGGDENCIIIYGHGRYEAAKKLGLSSVPVVVLTGLSEKEKDALRIADNRLVEMSNWDNEILQHEITKLFEVDFDLSFLDLDKYVDVPNKKEEKYTQKIESVIYEPSKIKPSIDSLYDDKKYKEIVARIKDEKNISDEIRDFLILCATRHIRFNFSRIADFYAHSDVTVKKLLEDQVAVIVDYDSLIEKGFIELTKKLNRVRESE